MPAIWRRRPGRCWTGSRHWPDRLGQEEIRLLAAGARVAADLAALPAADRPGHLPETWERAAVTFPERARAITDADGRGQPAVAAFGALAAAEHARQHPSDDPTTWRAAAVAWRVAGQPYREAVHAPAGGAGRCTRRAARPGRPRRGGGGGAWPAASRWAPC